MMCQWHVTDFRLESISPVNRHCFSSSCQLCFSFTVFLSKPVISEKHSIPRLKQLNQFPLTQANHNHLNHLQLSQWGYTEPKCLPPLTVRTLKFKKRKLPGLLLGCPGLYQHFQTEMHNARHLLIRDQHFWFHFTLSDYFGQCQVISKFKHIIPRCQSHYSII